MKVFLPHYENTLYRDVQIEGRWEGKTNLDGEDLERIWEITRAGHSVTATITSTSGTDKGQIYKMCGEFKNSILTGSYISANPTRTDRGSYTFKLGSDGQKLEGMMAAYSKNHDKVVHAVYTLVRKPD